MRDMRIGSGRGLRLGMVVIAAGLAVVGWHKGGAAEVAVSPAEAEGIIFERQQVMTRLGEDADVLGKVMAGQLPADRMAPAARAIATGAREAIDSFRQPVPGGKAKPELWANQADFAARMDKFAVNAEAMAKAAEAGDKGAVLGLMVDAMPCKECHDLYREKKKS